MNDLTKRSERDWPRMNILGTEAKQAKFNRAALTAMVIAFLMGALTVWFIIWFAR